MAEWYKYQKEYLDKMAELEKRDLERKKKQKAIEESLKIPEVLITTETQEKIEKQIQESLAFIEDLNDIILEKKEEIKGLEFDFINKVGELQDLEAKIKSNINYAKLLDKLDELKKKKSKSID
jgi:hypothetical protein